MQNWIAVTGLYSAASRSLYAWASCVIRAYAQILIFNCACEQFKNFCGIHQYSCTSRLFLGKIKIGGAHDSFVQHNSLVGLWLDQVAAGDVWLIGILYYRYQASDPAGGGL